MYTVLSNIAINGRIFVTGDTIVGLPLAEAQKYIDLGIIKVKDEEVKTPKKAGK